jgi:hypothetical protein
VVAEFTDKCKSIVFTIISGSQSLINLVTPPAYQAWLPELAAVLSKKNVHMKQFIFLVLSILIINISYSQDADYNGSAKADVKAFWDEAMKLEQSIATGAKADGAKIVGLARKIQDVKARDAAYNTAAMEAKYKKLSEKLVAAKPKTGLTIQDRHDMAMKSQQVAKILNSLFHISTQVDNGRLKTIKQEIEDYKTKTDEVLTMDTSNNKSELRQHLAQLKISFKSTENDLLELDRRLREQTKPENAEVKYYEILYKQAYWDAAQRIYAGEENFKKAYLLATKLLQGLGSIDDVHKIATKSKQQKINDTKLPLAAMKDAAMEKMFMDAFNKYHGEEFKGTAMKAILTSDDWSIERNEITGIVTGRVRRAVIVYKGSEGKCYLTANFFLHQEYVGNTFSSSPTSKFPIMGSQEMLCSNVK